MMLRPETSVPLGAPASLPALPALETPASLPALPDAGDASVPSNNAGRDASVSSTGDASVPSTGDASVPSTGDASVPSTGDAGAPGAPSRPRQWYSRGYLPHVDYPGLLQFITFRLADSVPLEVVHRWREELGWHTAMKADDPVVIELFKRIERYEDAGHGECWLKYPAVAATTENALLHFDGERYRLIAWCIMPNHVHVLIETMRAFPLDKVVHSWKSYTASQSNKLLGRKGTFWMREYHDRFIRDSAHFERTKAYIEQNPVKARLVAKATEWQWGSASRRAGRDAGAPSIVDAQSLAGRDAGAPSIVGAQSLAGRDAGAPSSAGADEVRESLGAPPSLASEDVGECGRGAGGKYVC